MIDDDQFSPEETKRRMESALRRALTTPHKPHAPLKAKRKPSRRKAATAKAKKRA